METKKILREKLETLNKNFIEQNYECGALAKARIAAEKERDFLRKLCDSQQNQINVLLTDLAEVKESPALKLAEALAQNELAFVRQQEQLFRFTGEEKHGTEAE